MRPLDGVAETARSAGPPVVAQARIELTPYVIVVLLTAVLAVVIAAAVWRHRRNPGGVSLTALALGAAWWSLFYALELGSPTLQGTLLFGRLSYLGIVVVPPAWFVFGLAYTGRIDLLTPGRLLALAVPSAVTFGLAWTTLSTGLVWQNPELVPEAGLSLEVLSVAYGPAFWLWTAYAYVLTGTGTVLVVLSVAKARLYRRQTAVLLVGVSAPWVGNLAFVVGPAPVDLTPVGFAVSAVFLGGGLLRYRLLDVHPMTGEIARDELVERLPEAVVVVDDGGRIADLNPSAESVLGADLDDAVGAELTSVAPTLADLVADARREETTETVADYVVTDPRRVYEVRVSTLRSESSEIGLLTLSDVTERRRREQEVAVLNRVLRHDLRNDVTVIQNYAGLLERDPGNEEYVAGLVERAAEMRDLVDTVRQVERHLDAAEPALSTLNIVRVVREQTDALARTHPEVTVETALPSDTWVRVMDLIGSAIDNLVENAVVHNDAASPHVCVSVARVTVDDERYVDVTVADDGPTIAERDRNVLVGAESSLDDASGLGLWLVNWIVTESGGQVSHEPNTRGHDGPRGNVVTLRLRTPEGDQYGSGGDTSAEFAATHRRDLEPVRSGSVGLSPTD